MTPIEPKLDLRACEGLGQLNEDIEATRTKIDEEIIRLESQLLQLRRRRNSLAPINQLPTEILLHIMRNLPPDALPTSAWSLTPHVWIQFTHVCHHWRALSLDDPSLWTNLRIPSMRPSLLKACIHRSQDAPLSITVDGYLRSTSLDLMEILLRSTDVTARVTNFHIMNHPAPWANELEGSLLSISPLKQLTLHNRTFHHQTCRRTLSLRYLDLASCHFDTAFISQSLVTLKLQDLVVESLPSASDFYKTLLSLTNLRHLVLNNVLGKMATKWQLPFSTPRGSLPSLQTLELVDEPENECARVLSRIAFPHLTQLYVYFNKEPTSLSLLNTELVNTWTSTRLLGNSNPYKTSRFSLTVSNSGNIFDFYRYDFPGEVTTRIKWSSGIEPVTSLLATFPQDKVYTIEVVWDSPSEEDFLTLSSYLSKLPFLKTLFLTNWNFPWLYPPFLESGLPPCNCLQYVDQPSNMPITVDPSGIACFSCQEFASSFFPSLRALGFYKAKDVMNVDQQLLQNFLAHRTACGRPIDWVNIYCENDLEIPEVQVVVQRFQDMGRESTRTDGQSTSILIIKSS
ncbi:hypothetical protein AX16_004742 [Volvariella volvacea WC 439]|nr:hypothetical protein AX16_004742 [Volvariella volvacea WC 439]